jgi:hypothetical protein
MASPASDLCRARLDLADKRRSTKEVIIIDIIENQNPSSLSAILSHA